MLRPLLVSGEPSNSARRSASVLVFVDGACGSQVAFIQIREKVAEYIL